MATGTALVIRKLEALGRELPKATETAVAEAALVVKGSVAKAAGRYATSPLARVRIHTSRSSAVVLMTSRKAHLLDRNTKPHAIAARRRQALSTPNGAFASVSHPGTKGKFMWERGVAEALPLVEKILDERFGQTLRSVFGP